MESSGKVKRDIKADLEMCEKATPGPWSKSRMDMDSYSCNEKGDYEIVAYVYRNPEPRIPCFGLQFRNDAKFISESREALPHYIKRTMEAEDLLKATLEQLDVDCRTCVWGNKCYQCKRQKLIDRIKDYLG
jgi:hypothetical protein